MKAFNIRVYGILMDDENNILVTDENIRGMLVTKFPGGGLEFGEGTKECLIREFKEELNLKIEVKSHFYTTDFFQISAFNKNHQVISIYYKVKALEKPDIPLESRPFEFNEIQLKQLEETGECEAFRFIPLKDIHSSQFTLPIDKVVAELLMKEGV